MEAEGTSLSHLLGEAAGSCSLGFCLDQAEPALESVGVSRTFTNVHCLGVWLHLEKYNLEKNGNFLMKLHSYSNVKV